MGNMAQAVYMSNVKHRLLYVVRTCLKEYIKRAARMNVVSLNDTKLCVYLRILPVLAWH